MAVYWVDPYITAPIGGIHGTTDTTTRSGTYSAPFSFEDLIATTQSYNTMNGTTLSNGDEIRLKGLASIEDFLYPVSGATNGKIPITSTTAQFIYFDHLTYNTPLTSAHSAYATQYSNSSAALPLVIFDPFFDSTGQYDFFLTQTNASAVGNGYLSMSNANRSNATGWLRLKGNYLNDPAAVQTHFGLLHYNYIIDFDTPINSSSARFLLGLQTQVTYTDGWTSETTRNGITLLSGSKTNTSNAVLSFFNTNIQQNSALRPTAWDLPDTHFYTYNPTSYFYNNTLRPRFDYLPDSAVKFGGFHGSSNNSWNYIYMSQTESALNTNNFIADIGMLSLGRYIYYNGTGFKSANTMYGKFRVRNIICGMAPYVGANQVSLTFGNIISGYQYSEGVALYNTGNNINWTFEANKFIAVRDAAILIRVPPSSYGSLTIGANVSNPPADLVDFPNWDSTWGPKIAKLQPVDGRGFEPNGLDVPLTASSWIDGVAVTEGMVTQYTYDNGNVSHNLGSLACNGNNYRTTEHDIQLRQMKYHSFAEYTDGHLVFSRNDYDDLPILLWIPEGNTINGFVVPLLSYNDSSGNMVVHGTDKLTSNKNYVKHFMAELPDLSTGTTLNFSIDITRSTNATGAVSVRTWTPKVGSDNADDGSQGSSSSTNGVTTISNAWNMSTFSINTDAKFMGYSISLPFNANSTVSDTFTISEPTITVT